MNLLCIDIGGTAAKMGLVDDQGKVLAQREAVVAFDQYQTPILTTVLQKSKAFLMEEGSNVQGIGISATGQIDMNLGFVAGTCGNLPGWVGTPLKQAFEKNFNLPTAVLNDANSALLGEQWVGGAKGIEDAVMVTLGTGVGGGILSGGRLVTGSQGFGGELGHMPINVNGLLCTCGNRGCYEQYASVTALIKSAEPWLKELGITANGRNIFALAQNHNEKAMAALEEWIDAIAAGLVGFTHLFNPRLLLIGGGVSAQKNLLIEPLRKKVFQKIMPRYRENLMVAAATLGNTAGMLGAAKHWLNTAVS